MGVAEPDLPSSAGGNLNCSCCWTRFAPSDTYDSPQLGSAKQMAGKLGLPNPTRPLTRTDQSLDRVRQSGVTGLPNPTDLNGLVLCTFFETGFSNAKWLINATESEHIDAYAHAIHGINNRDGINFDFLAWQFRLKCESGFVDCWLVHFQHVGNTSFPVPLFGISGLGGGNDYSECAWWRHCMIDSSVCLFSILVWLTVLCLLKLLLIECQPRQGQAKRASRLWIALNPRISSISAWKKFTRLPSG